MAFDIDDIINRVSIVDYISKYVTLKKKGANHWGLCPFHNEKTPSFTVSEDKKIFKCFGCGKGGNVLSFVHEYEKVEWGEAIRMLADYAGIKEIDSPYKKKKDLKKDKKEKYYLIQKKIAEIFHKELFQSQLAKEYLKNRKITKQTVEHLKIGFAPDSFRFIESKIFSNENQTAERQKEWNTILTQCGLITEKNGTTYNRFRNRIIFPIADGSGNISGFGGRTLESDSKFAKYLNSPESLVFEKKNILYHLYQAKDFIRKEKNVYLVEGYFDVAGLVNSGIMNTVAPMGTSFTENQARILKRYSDKVSIFFDNDGAGIEAAFKAVKILRMFKFEIFVIRIPEKFEGKDPYDLSIDLPVEEFFSILDDPLNEIQFVLWYFFSKKYNIQKIEEKRKSINEFFAYIHRIETNWEQEDFIKKGSEVLSIPYDIFKEDFHSVQSPNEGLPEKQFQSAQPKTLKPFTREKELLALLLRFPEFWEKKEALTKIIWKDENTELLYSFFRDRLADGEFWHWDELNKVFNLLPENLGNLLAEIIYQYEDQLGKDAKAEDYLKSFQSIMLSIKITEIDEKIKDLKTSIKMKEMMKEDIEEESIEIGNLIREKNRLNTLKRK